MGALLSCFGIESADDRADRQRRDQETYDQWQASVKAKALKYQQDSDRAVAIAAGQTVELAASIEEHMAHVVSGWPRGVGSLLAEYCQPSSSPPSVDIAGVVHADGTNAVTIHMERVPGLWQLRICHSPYLYEQLAQSADVWTWEDDSDEDISRFNGTLLMRIIEAKVLIGTDGSLIDVISYERHSVIASSATDAIKLSFNIFGRLFHDSTDWYTICSTKTLTTRGSDETMTSNVGSVWAPSCMSVTESMSSRYN